MVAKIFSHAWQILNYWNVKTLQVFRRTDAGKHQ